MQWENIQQLSVDLEGFPPLDDYWQGLQSLLSPDMVDLPYEELTRRCAEKMMLFQQSFGINGKVDFNTRTFYRARFNIGPREDSNLISTHSYPPAFVCKENGRANLKGRSVFYCSEMANTAILESKPSIGQTGYLSVWSGNASRDVKYGICLHQDLPSDNPYHAMMAGITGGLHDHVKRNAGDKAAHLVTLHRFVAERFVCDKPPYTLTSWIANEMLYETTPRDYIIYPSMAHDQLGCNLAFHPNSADTLLRFWKMLKFDLSDRDEDNMKMSNCWVGELSGPRICWRRPHVGEFEEVFG